MTQNKNSWIWGFTHTLRQTTYRKFHKSLFPSFVLGRLYFNTKYTHPRNKFNKSSVVCKINYLLFRNQRAWENQLYNYKAIRKSMRLRSYKNNKQKQHCTLKHLKNIFISSKQFLTQTNVTSKYKRLHQ